MFTYNPTRVIYGSDFDLLLEEAAIRPRLGTRALVITNGELARDGTVHTIRESLERGGVESILLDGAGDHSAGDIVEEAGSLATGGRAGFIVGVGTPLTLDIAKAAAFSAGDRSGAYGSSGSIVTGAATKTLPFLAVPTRCWNPLLFSDMAVVSDGRDRPARLLRTGIHPDSAFFLTGLLDNLTVKQVMYDLVCIVSNCVETSVGGPGTIGYPFVTGAFTQAVSILRAIPTSDVPPDRKKIQIAGIHSAWFPLSPGVGFALGRSAYGQTGILPEWITATLVPEVTAHLVNEDPARSELLSGLMNLERTGESARDAEDIDKELRSLLAIADVPLRLRDLGLDRDLLADIAVTAADLCNVDGDTLSSLLEAAF